MRKAEFFNTKFNIEKTFWTYQDKFEDVSIYFCKDDNPGQSSSTNQFQSYVSMPPVSMNSPVAGNSPNDTLLALSEGCITLTAAVVPRPDSFYNKLKLWKCCTLVKTPNLTLEKILNRIKNERYFQINR